MTVRPLSVAVIVAAFVFSLAGQKSRDNKAHLDFSLVRGSIAHVAPQPGRPMSEAPSTFLSFTGRDGHSALVVSDTRGDYTAALQPGHYCVLAYDIKTGEQIVFDSRQQKCIDVVFGNDVRLDVMLHDAH